MKVSFSYLMQSLICMYIIVLWIFETHFEETRKYNIIL